MTPAPPDLPTQLDGETEYQRILGLFPEPPEAKRHRDNAREVTWELAHLPGNGIQLAAKWAELLPAVARRPVHAELLQVRRTIKTVAGQLTDLKAGDPKIGGLIEQLKRLDEEGTPLRELAERANREKAPLLIRLNAEVKAARRALADRLELYVGGELVRERDAMLSRNPTLYRYHSPSIPGTYHALYQKAVRLSHMVLALRSTTTGFAQVLDNFWRGLDKEMCLSLSRRLKLTVPYEGPAPLVEKVAQSA